MNRSEQPPSLFGPAHRTLTLGVIGAVSLVGFEAMAVATILPTAARELDGLSAYGWAFAAFMLANLVGTMGAGELADARGPRLPLLLAAAAMALGLGIGAFAPSWEILLVGRAFQGLGGGALLTLGYLAIRRGYPEAVRPRMLAVVSSSWILPSLLGPVAAGALAERASWRLAFALLVPLLLASLALLFPALGRLPPVAGRPALGRTGRTALLALCLGLFLASLQLRTLWTLPGALLAGTLALLFARSILPAGTLRLARGLPAGLVFRSLLSFVFFGAEAFVPLGLSTLRGFSPTAGGLVLTGASLAWVVGSWTQARIDERRGPDTRPARMLAGIALVGMGIAFMAFCVLTPSVPAILAAVGWAVAGFGMGIGYPSTSVLVLDAAPEGEEGFVSAALNLMENVGIALGAGLGGAAYGIARAAAFAPPIALGLAYAVVLAALPLGVIAAARVRTRA